MTYIVKRKLQSVLGGGRGSGEGVQGEMGVPGTSGAAGIPGVGGVPGLPGTPGAAGVIGTRGAMGIAGAVGAAGAPGISLADISNLIQHTQTSTAGLVLNYDSLTVNHLIVRRTMRAPFGTDKYK